MLDRGRQRARVSRRDQEAGDVSPDDLAHPPGVRRDHRSPCQHRLHQHSAKRLGQHRRVDDDVARRHQRRHVAARAGQVHAAGERRRARSRAEGGFVGVVSREQRAADHERVDGGDPGDGVEQHVLPFPRMEAAEAADDERILRNAERGPGVAPRGGRQRIEWPGVDAVVHDAHSRRIAARRDERVRRRLRVGDHASHGAVCQQDGGADVEAAEVIAPEDVTQVPDDGGARADGCQDRHDHRLR